MALITRVQDPNAWEAICADFESRRPPFPDPDSESVATERIDYDPAKVTPVFYGKMFAKVTADDDHEKEFDAAVSHPACVGYAFIEKPPAPPPPPPAPLPDKDKCLPREYLESYIFPVLLPALEEMLRQAKKERCFERKRTKFNALDFLTEYLYKYNPQQEGRENVVFEEIPFVKEWWKEHPRQPLPMSLLWSEEEATLIIQSFWRGFKVRREPEIQELRQWQKDWREENENIKKKVDEFWAKKMPGGDDCTGLVADEKMGLVIDMAMEPVVLSNPEDNPPALPEVAKNVDPQQEEVDS